MTNCHPGLWVIMYSFIYRADSFSFYQSYIKVVYAFSLLLRDDTDLRGVQEFDNVSNLFAVGHLVTYLQRASKTLTLPLKTSR